LPTARELLEQVDALMRRNRALEAAAAARDAPVPTRAPPPASDEVPVLTEAVSAPLSDEVPVLTETVPPPASDAVPVLTEIVAPPDAAAAEARWRALAADVEMQVLQRIDIFTDTGLQEQLAAKLQPIVDRASADLVATISGQVGQLLRSYVAEAVEREIDQLRQGGR
jgi:hypothetical protein